MTKCPTCRKHLANVRYQEGNVRDIARRMSRMQDVSPKYMRLLDEAKAITADAKLQLTRHESTCQIPAV